MILPSPLAESCECRPRQPCLCPSQVPARTGRRITPPGPRAVRHAPALAPLNERHVRGWLQVRGHSAGPRTLSWMPSPGSTASPAATQLAAVAPHISWNSAWNFTCCPVVRAGALGGLGPRPPPLVAEEGRAAAIRTPRDGIDGGAAGQQGLGDGRAAVVLQGPEEGIHESYRRGAWSRRSGSEPGLPAGPHIPAVAVQGILGRQEPGQSAASWGPPLTGHECTGGAPCSRLHVPTHASVPYARMA
jgi:hypothetical protein